jgi:tRNA threonylcarbamoyl adenosine modification protein YjeE
MIFFSKNVSDTRELAHILSREILFTKLGNEKAVVLGLVGELGAGKTAFTKEFIKTAGVKEKVSSPTFLIMRGFDLKSKKTCFKKIYHIDAYRIEPEDLLKLGLKEIINDPENIVMVEWADKVRKIMPRGTFWINFKHGKNENERNITFNRR